MSDNPANFWTDDTSVIFTSFWGWSPETWGTVGWTGSQGLARRDNLLRELTDPFIAVIYVTESSDQEELRGAIVGFYLVSHETGHRNDFTHPELHDLAPEKWEHSLRALRAFTYVPEYRMKAIEFDGSLTHRGLAVSKWAEVITKPAKIARLRETPWIEVEVYVPNGAAVELAEADLEPNRGFTRAGPANQNGYVVSSSAQELGRQLYILCLGGSADAYLGKSSGGQRIYKIGLSASPQFRMQSLQKAMPNGAFVWSVHRQSGNPGEGGSFSFEAAVTGEYAMKTFLSRNAEWLGGEFYLATQSDAETAWKLGLEAAANF